MNQQQPNQQFTPMQQAKNIQQNQQQPTYYYPMYDQNQMQQQAFMSQNNQPMFYQPVNQNYMNQQPIYYQMMQPMQYMPQQQYQQDPNMYQQYQSQPQLLNQPVQPNQQQYTNINSLQQNNISNIQGNQQNIQMINNTNNNINISNNQVNNNNNINNSINENSKIQNVVQVSQKDIQQDMKQQQIQISSQKEIENLSHDHVNPQQQQQPKKKTKYHRYLVYKSNYLEKIIKQKNENLNELIGVSFQELEENPEKSKQTLIELLDKKQNINYLKWTIGFFEPGEKQKSLHNKPKVMMKKFLSFLSIDNLQKLQINSKLQARLDTVVENTIKTGIVNNNKNITIKNIYSHAHFHTLFLILTEQNLRKLVKSHCKEKQLHEQIFEIQDLAKITDEEKREINFLKQCIYFIMNLHIYNVEEGNWSPNIKIQDQIKLDIKDQSEQEKMFIDYSYKVFYYIKQMNDGILISKF